MKLFAVDTLADFPDEVGLIIVSAENKDDAENLVKANFPRITKTEIKEIGISLNKKAEIEMYQ